MVDRFRLSSNLFSGYNRELDKLVGDSGRDGRSGPYAEIRREICRMEEKSRDSAIAKALGCLGAAFLCLVVSSCSEPDTDTPEAIDKDSSAGMEKTASVVLFSLDTVRADHVSTYGYPRPTTPRIDEFSKDGCVFERAYAHAPFTLTSHMSLFTSLFPETHGVQPDSRLHEKIPLLAEVMQERGYVTWGFYDNSWLDPLYGFGRGFDGWERHRDGAETLSQTLALIPKLKAGGEPFFLFVHVMEAHCGPMGGAGNPLYNAPSSFRDRFVPHADVDPSRYLDRDIYTDRVELDGREAENVVAQYDGGLLYCDWIVGEVLAQLEREDLYEESLIVVTSDHGESLGDHGTFDGHGYFWEEGLRIPLVVKLPRGHEAYGEWRNSRRSDAVQSVDVVPTVFEALGWPRSPHFQGRSLFDRTTRKIFAQREKVAVLVDGPYKAWLRPGAEDRLFRLDLDPGEENPLDDPDRLYRMRKEMRGLVEAQRAAREALIDGEAGGRVKLTPEMRERLKAMGYLKDES